MTRPLSITQLNDMFRATFIGGEVVITSGIAALTPQTRSRILDATRTFSAFTPDNDPRGEHDFGSFRDPDAGTIFWKIDYYDQSLKGGSEDPANPGLTTRVLTIMLAGEY